MNLLKKVLIVPSLILLISSNLIAQKIYTLEALPLKNVIKIITNDMNLPYVVDSKFIEGKRSKKIQNIEGSKKALEKVLKEFNLEVEITNDLIVIKKMKLTSSSSLGEVDIIGTLNNITEDSNSYNIEAMNTATRLNLSSKETPQSVSVLTRKKLDDLGLTNLNDALSTVTGINVIPDSGKSRFQSRGYTIDQIQVDGVSSTSPGSMFNIYRTAKPLSDLAIYDHIEVVRGATGLSQGNGEPGGTVNLVRKKPTKDLRVNTEFSVGNWNKKRLVGDISGSLNEEKTISARLIAVLDKSKSFKDEVENKSKEVYGVVDFNLSDNSILSLGIDYQTKTSTIDYFGLPTGVNGKDLELSESTFLGADWTNEELEKTNIFAELDHNFNDNWNFEAKLNYRKSNSKSKIGALANGSSAYTGVGSDGLLKTNNLHRYDNESVIKSFQADVTGKYDLFGQSHEVFTGFTISREEYNSRWRRVSNSDMYNIYNFNGNNIVEPNWNDTSSLFNDSDYQYRFYQNAVNLATRLNFTDKLHLLLGTRYSHFKTEGYNFDRKWGSSTNNLYPNTKINKHRFIPYLGLTYDLNDTSTLYASYTSIYKPQITKDKDKKLLDPIIGNNYEIGLKSNFFNDELKTSFTLFQINQENRSVSDSDSSGSFFIPIGESRSRGFETEISGSITDNFMLSAGYTFNKSIYLEKETDNNTSGMNFSKHTPKHMLKVYANYKLPVDEKRWEIGLGMKSQSKTNSLYNVGQSGFSIWNSNLNYRVNKNITLRLNANNIFDKRYYLNSRTRIAGMNNFYGDPRNFMFTLNWKL